MNNLNKTYHKGKYRSGEWAKHLRPFLKRAGNKRWRKTGKNIEPITEETGPKAKKYRKKRTITVRITKRYFGNHTYTTTSKYRKLRDAQNAMNQANVISAEIIEN